MSAERTPASTATTESLQAMAGGLVAVYRTTPPVATLYARACIVVGSRAAALLRRHVDPRTMALPEGLPLDDQGLVLQTTRDALALVAMAEGRAILSTDQLREIITR